MFRKEQFLLEVCIYIRTCSVLYMSGHIVPARPKLHAWDEKCSTSESVIRGFTEEILTITCIIQACILENGLTYTYMYMYM